MTYLEHVTTYFVSLVGRGLALSSRDIQVVSEWESAGFQPHAVCRTIGNAYRKAGKQDWFSLSDCDDAVRKLPRSHGVETVQTGPDWTTALLLQRLEAVGKTTEEGPLLLAYRALYQWIRALPDKTLSADEVTRLDKQAVASLEQQLEKYEVRRQRQVARQQAKRLLPDAATKQAREGLAAALLERSYREEYHLTVPSDLLAEEDT